MSYIDIKEQCPSCYTPLGSAVTRDEDFTFKVCSECTMRVLVEPIADKSSPSGLCYVIATDQLVPVFKYEVLHPISRMRVLSRRWATLGRIYAMNALPIDRLRKEVRLSEIEDGLVGHQDNLDSFQWNDNVASEDDISLSVFLSQPSIALS